MRSQGRIWRAAVGVAALAVLLVVVGPAGSQATAAPDAAETEGEQQPVVLVLDASGSMDEADGSGDGSRMDAAKDAVTDLIAGTPSEAELGVLVYGSEVGNTGAEKEAGCQDIVTLADVGPVDAQALTDRVLQVEASGWTPIGTALERAADVLPDEGPRSIVLVSDGIDTCAPPDPCEVAEGLAQDGVDLRVHTVGFHVDAQAREQLQCIAEVTGGTYADASGAGELSEELSIQVQRAMRSYLPAGRPIQGGPDEEGALEITAGDYVLQLASTKGPDPARAVQVFTVPMRQGETLHASASLVRPQERGEATVLSSISVTQLGAATCRSDYDQNNARNTNGGPPTAVLITRPAEADHDCFPEGYAVFAVERSGAHAANADLPVELSVTVEPPIDTATVRKAPVAEIDLPEIDEPDLAGAVPVTPGLNYSTATGITPGTYRSEITGGEFHVYAVRLEPGQRLAAAVLPESGVGERASLQLNIAAPDRTALGLTESSVGYRNGHFVSGIEDGELLADRMGQTVDPAAPEPPNRAGEYYVMVSLASPDRTVVPYALAVDVAGDAVPEPTFIEDPEPLTEVGKTARAQEAATEQTDGDTDAATAPVVADPDPDLTGPTTDVDAGDVVAGDDAGPDAGGGGIRPVTWLLAAAGVLLAAGGGWLLATRHRR